MVTGNGVISTRVSVNFRKRNRAGLFLTLSHLPQRKKRTCCKFHWLARTCPVFLFQGSERTNYNSMLLVPFRKKRYRGCVYFFLNASQKKKPTKIIKARGDSWVLVARQGRSSWVFDKWQPWATDTCTTLIILELKKKHRRLSRCISQPPPPFLVKIDFLGRSLELRAIQNNQLHRIIRAPSTLLWFLFFHS